LKTLSSLATICTNIENGAEFLNPSIVTDLNDETGKQMKTMFFNQSSMADVIFRVEGKSYLGHLVVLTALERLEHINILFKKKMYICTTRVVS
jgi:hypothetical protein